MVGTYPTSRNPSARSAAALDGGHLGRWARLIGIPSRSVGSCRQDVRGTGRAAEGVDTVIFADLDGFKAVNDEHGHAAGDEVLRVVAERLAAETRPEDLVARLGGDEFAVLCMGLTQADATGLMDRLRTAVATPIEIGRGSVTVGLSIGVADSFDGAGLEELLRTADERMYSDKAARAGAA